MVVIVGAGSVVPLDDADEEEDEVDDAEEDEVDDALEVDEALDVDDALVDDEPPSPLDELVEPAAPEELVLAPVPSPEPSSLEEAVQATNVAKSSAELPVFMRRITSPPSRRAKENVRANFCMSMPRALNRRAKT